MATEVVVRKWGNSLGVAFPKEFAKRNNLKLDEKIVIEVVKEADLRPVFGSLKTKMTGQEFKDMVRKGWK